MTNKVKIFNTPLEIGLRTAFLLGAFHGRNLDLQKLVYFDYFLIHSGDIENGPVSLHPASPFRSGEIAIKRELLKKALQLFHRKNLVNTSLTKEGVTYSITLSGKDFLQSQVNGYASSLAERSIWVEQKFGKMSQEELEKFVSSNIKSWGVEFISKD